MSLYTLIIDFDGGTYITQANSKSFGEAPLDCVRNWDISNISSDVSEKDKLFLLRQLQSEEFVLLDKTTHVWCGSVPLKETLLVMHLVLTENAL